MKLVENRNARVVVLITSREHAHSVIAATSDLEAAGHFIWVASDAWASAATAMGDLGPAMWGTVIVSPFGSSVPEYHEYFLNLTPVCFAVSFFHSSVSPSLSLNTRTHINLSLSVNIQYIFILLFLRLLCHVNVHIKTLLCVANVRHVEIFVNVRLVQNLLVCQLPLFLSSALRETRATPGLRSSGKGSSTARCTTERAVPTKHCTLERANCPTAASSVTSLTPSLSSLMPRRGC